MRNLLSSLLLFVTVVSNAAEIIPVPSAPPLLKVLFLGDKGHHVPVQRYGWIKEPFAGRGIQLDYTEKMSDLNVANLAQYDVVLVYANILTIQPEQEQALYDFVANGKGFAPIHCGSACFTNSDKMIALTGGLFVRHKTAVFAPLTTNSDHPIMKFYRNYEAWDETYTHDKHNEKDRTVLQLRTEAGDKEPWTWVRNEGKGRVFYTAGGHDERVWSQPAYQELLARGVAWAAGEKGLPILNEIIAEGEARSKRAPLKYEPRPTVQNYEKRVPYPQYQFPLAPKESQDYIETQPGFKLELFASEPDVIRPVALAWDPKGRLYVLEAVDYPSTVTEPWKGHDRIVICEDTNGDGKADKFTVFAEGINLGTGMCFANGGVIVAQQPNFLFLKDTDGDDKADVKEVIMSGWGTGDTHAGPSNLKYGFDNKIYGAVGYSGFNGTVGNKKQSFAQGSYRINRSFSEVEFLAQYTNNTWGFGLNEAGEFFGSTANGAHHFYTPLPLPYLMKTSGLESNKALSVSPKIDSHYNARPVTQKIRQVDVFGGFTAEAGQNLYTARAFPKAYWNKCALVCEPTMHILHQGFFERDGSGWTEGVEQFNLVAGEDEWFAPVYAETGPDGSVWFCDWYNFIIQHNPTPRKEHGGFDTTTGKGGAHVNPLRDNEHGRIYRITWKGAKPYQPLKLDINDPKGLIEALGNDNQFWRLTAQRLLVERGNLDVVPALIEASKDQSVDEIGLNGRVVHALWTLQGLGLLEGTHPEVTAAAIATLKHPSAGVRRNAVQTLPKNKECASALIASGLLSDPDLNVRLAAFLGASDFPSNDEMGAALYAESKKKEVQGDKWLPPALLVAASKHANGYLNASLVAEAANLEKATGNPTDDAPVSNANLIVNGSFEKLSENAPLRWSPRNYVGEVETGPDSNGKIDSTCLKISSKSGADSSWHTLVTVKPKTKYKLSAWIKTKDVDGAMGALLNIHTQPERTRAISGSKNWTQVTLEFDSGERTQLDINCLFGGWGKSTGTAWFDGVELIETGKATADSNLRIVAQNLPKYAALSEQIALAEKLKGLNPGVTAEVLDGMTQGWYGKPGPGLSDAEKTQLATLGTALSANNKLRLEKLVEIWGQKGEVHVAENADKTPPLSPDQQKRADAGKARYMGLCVACHQPNGMGLPVLAPPLVGSEFVTGPESRLARIVLHGLHGPVTAAGVKFTMPIDMPPLAAQLDDTAIAEILTFVRNEWGNHAPPVEAAAIKAAREAEAKRTKPWTVDELLKVP